MHSDSTNIEESHLAQGLFQQKDMNTTFPIGCDFSDNKLPQFNNNNSTIYQGDCLEVFPHIEDKSIDLIFADPPYNIGKKFGDFHDRWSSDAEYAEWCYKWLEECIKKLKSSGSLYVMTSTQSMPYIDLWIRDRMTVLSRIVWHYDSSGVQARNYFGSLYEPILFCTKDSKNYTFNSKDIEVEARTGSVRKLIDYRKEIPVVVKWCRIYCICGLGRDCRHEGRFAAPRCA